MTEELALRVDMDVNSWKVREGIEFKKRIGVTAHYALMQIQHSWESGIAEARTMFGDQVDLDGWSPPADWIPDAILDVDPTYLLGFTWIAHLRDCHHADFDAWLAEISLGELTKAFWSGMNAPASEDECPKAETPKRSTTGRHSKTAGDSAEPTQPTDSATSES